MHLNSIFLPSDLHTIQLKMVALSLFSEDKNWALPSDFSKNTLLTLYKHLWFRVDDFDHLTLKSLLDNIMASLLSAVITWCRQHTRCINSLPPKDGRHIFGFLWFSFRYFGQNHYPEVFVEKFWSNTLMGKRLIIKML